jgi:uncharacterized phage protein (TIGR02220 family)
VLGIYTKVHGERGCVTIGAQNAALAAEMGIPLNNLISTIALFPHVLLSGEPISWPHGHKKAPGYGVEYLRGGAPLDGRGEDMLRRWCERHGGITVTWHNWFKYQIDSTGAERAKTSRSKRRREEMRGDVDTNTTLSRSDSDQASPNGNPTQISRRILAFLNKKTGKRYQPLPAILDPIKARLADGATEDQIRAVIARKFNEWSGDPEMAKYLRPKTLFGRTNFAQYLGDLPDTAFTPTSEET